MTTPPDDRCTDGHCVTCGDEAVAGEIVRLLPDGMAILSTAQGEEEISVALVPAGPGDIVLVHAGEAIAITGE